MESLSFMDINEEKTNDWLIVCSQSLGHYVHCICGHRVKRITYLYHKPSRAIQYVGKTCVRKYGIEISLTNPILLDVIKANLKKADWDRDACVREYIQAQYTTFMTMALTEESSDISVNKVVGPFRRLLSDVCDLVSEYGFDLVDILRDIEREVESLNQAARHQMVDEYSLCDSISEIASEHTDVTDEEVVESVGSEPVVEDTEDEPVSDIVDEHESVYDIIEEPVVENPIIEDEPVSDIVEEPVVENPIIEDEPVYDIVNELVVEDTVDEPVYDIVEEPVVENPIIEDEPVVEEEPVVENPIIEYEPVIEDEPVVENPIIEDEHVVENPIIEDEPVVEEEPVVENPIIEDERVIEDEDVSVFDIVKSTEDESVMVENPVVENLVVDNAVGDVIEGVLKSLEDSVTKKETAMERFLRTTSNINIGDTDLCSATTHCYCAMKYRVRLLHEGIEELRFNIEQSRRESQKLIQESIEQRMKTNEFLERSRKAHPDLFPPENTDEKN